VVLGQAVLPTVRGEQPRAQEAHRPRNSSTFGKSAQNWGCGELLWRADAAHKHKFDEGVSNKYHQSTSFFFSKQYMLEKASTYLDMEVVCKSLQSLVYSLYKGQ